HPADCAQMLELPFAVDLYVIVFIAGCQPIGAVTLAKSERSHEIPARLCPIAVNFNDRVHHIVLREADTIAKALEQVANRRMALMGSDAGALPDPIFGKERRDHVGIMIIVADCTVTGFEFFDRLDIFENSNSLFQFLSSHGLTSSIFLV